jgi:hypothetical protein
MLFRDVASNGPTHTTSRGTWRADAKLHNSFSTLRATSVWGYTHAYVRTYVDSYIHTFIHSFIHTMPPDILRFKVLLYRPWPAQTNHFQFRFPFHPSGGKDIIYIYTTIYIYIYILFFHVLKFDEDCINEYFLVPFARATIYHLDSFGISLG